MSGANSNAKPVKQHTTGGLKSEHADNAAWEAGKGAVIGASKVGLKLKSRWYDYI